MVYELEMGVIALPKRETIINYNCKIGLLPCSYHCIQLIKLISRQIKETQTHIKLNEAS